MHSHNFSPLQVVWSQPYIFRQERVKKEILLEAVSRGELSPAASGGYLIEGGSQETTTGKRILRNGGVFLVAISLEVIFSHLNPERLVNSKVHSSMRKEIFLRRELRECLYPGRSDIFGGSRAMWICKLANRGSHRSYHWRGWEIWNWLIDLILRKDESSMRHWHRQRHSRAKPI